MYRLLCTVAVAAFLGLGSAPIMAQQAPPAGQTVADLRAELATLSGQVQLLRDQLVQRGAGGGLPGGAADSLTRLDQLESELRRITSRVEVLTNDLDRIISEASNRIGEVEFRLAEVEGGAPPPPAADTPLLGGGLTALRPKPRAGQGGAVSGGNTTGAGPGAQLTVTERADFDAAVAAAEAGDHARATELFNGFLATYPGGPLAGEAQFRRGQSQEALSDWRGAARSYLDAFSGAPQDPIARQALFRLAISLNAFGSTHDACLTLTEVEIRYPGSDVATEVPGRRAAFGCP